MDIATNVRESEQVLASASGRSRVKEDCTPHFLMTSTHTNITDVISNARESFNSNLKRVDDLLDIHKTIGGEDPGRRDKQLAALNMSAIVLITACWESYLETLLSDVFKFLLDSFNSHEKVSNTLKKSVSEEIKKNLDNRRVWELTGDGWKNILKDKVKEKLDKFSSPSGNNVDRLFKQVLDLGRPFKILVLEENGLC